jgi:hypothetical protein
MPIDVDGVLIWPGGTGFGVTPISLAYAYDERHLIGRCPDGAATNSAQIGPPGWSPGHRPLSNKPRERRNPANSGASVTNG